MKTSELIEQLAAIIAEHGDLPVGGECEIGVVVTVCDADGHDISSGASYCGPAHMVFLDVR